MGNTGLLNGKVAVITGASRGIGRAIALTFVRNGADVVMTARSEEVRSQVVVEARTSGSQILQVNMDVSIEEDTQRMAWEALANFGHIDILVNNAGAISPPAMAVWETTVEEWDRIMNVNLRGAFLCCRAVLPHMVKRRSGCIVNIASVDGRTAEGNHGAYSTSKWGLIGYTASLAKSVRPYGIRVNAISPGWVDTDMSRDRLPYDTDAWSTPEQIAQVALFLVTTAPSDMTGQSIDVFGS